MIYILVQNWTKVALTFEGLKKAIPKGIPSLLEVFLFSPQLSSLYFSVYITTKVALTLEGLKKSNKDFLKSGNLECDL